MGTDRYAYQSRLRRISLTAEAASDRLGAGALPALRQRNGRPGHPAGDVGAGYRPGRTQPPRLPALSCASRWPSWRSDA